MGKTVPSYRMALEFEIHRWKRFWNALPSEEARVAFDELMDMCRDNGMASGNACNPSFRAYGYVYFVGSAEEVAGT